VKEDAMTGLEGLDVYRVALEFAEQVYALGLKGSIRDQLTRASESVVLNIAEAHPARGNERARKFQIALNEISECRGGIAILRVRRQIRREVYDELSKLIDRIAAMLWRLSHPD
jgi:four helix bundle protein